MYGPRSGRDDREGNKDLAAGVSNAFGFDTMTEALREATDRAGCREVRGLRRRIPDEDSEG
jgi:hypothetical protein